jgi:hypothetical protein
MNTKTLCLAAFLALCAPVASAYGAQYAFLDMNTRGPVVGANMSVYDGATRLDSQISNSGGFVLVDFNGSVNISYTVDKLGYLSFSANVSNITADYTESVFLTPLAVTGLIRVRFEDLTVAGSRGFCLYYDVNYRLAGCYQLNETVDLLTNQNYTLVPQIQRSDLLSTPESFIRWSYLFVPNIIMLGVAVAIAGFAFYFVVWRGKK